MTLKSMATLLVCLPAGRNAHYITYLDTLKTSLSFPGDEDAVVVGFYELPTGAEDAGVEVQGGI